MLNIRKEESLSTLENIKFILFTSLNQGFSDKLKFHPAIILFGFIAILLSSCSQEKHTFVSKNFHNTTAHYNAYFLAREKMKEVDADIVKANVDDYNKILSIYPQIEEGTVEAIKPSLEEVIKKASLIHEKHKNSVWLDDAYIIIGKSYFYRHEYPTAMAFFKYVNSNSKDNTARHEALVLLMRTYIDSTDYFSAKAVSDYVIKKEAEGTTLSPENAKDFYLAKAYYHQKLDEPDQMIPNLEKAVPLLKKREEKARINFILAQLYQWQKTDTAAYKHYKATIKRNPPYHLLFHAKLYSTQVSKLSKSSNRKNERYFKKLLKDKKNIDYKDKIYYEMARHELKQSNTPQAIVNLEKSLRAGTKNIPQKGLSYLKLGEIYYDKEQFDVSKLYYDSTVAVWDKEDKRYKSIASRQKTLAEFARHVQTVHREDSLQKLAKLPKEKLSQHIDAVIAYEKEQEKKKQIALENALKNKARAKSDVSEDPENNSSFPLTNSVAIVSGKAEFEKIWGTRKLEDNWRRSQKDNYSFAEEKPDELPIEEQKDTLSADTLQEKVVDKDLYYKDIPFTKEQLDTSNQRIEYALYSIGKIYNQKLNEPDRSIKSFVDHMKRFPKSEYKAEIYYFLYLIYKNKNEENSSQDYKRKLFDEYPSSLYAKLLKNPNYLQDNQQANLLAHIKYSEAYETYKAGSYKTTDSLINVIRIEFPDNDIDDKLSLLSIMILGQTSNAIVYKDKLQNFIDNYGSSPLVPKAQELLVAADAFIDKKSEKGQSIGIGDAKYSTELNKPHYMVAVFPKTIPYKKIIREFTSYHKNVSEEKGLSVDHISFSDTTYTIVVKEFGDKFPAQVYLNKLKNEKLFYKENGYLQYPVFIITNHNYSLFQEAKNLDGYLQFYKAKY